MAAKLKIVHQVPGRIRMKIPSAKGNPDQLETYKQVLSAIPGVESIEVNPVTGSIVLVYDPDKNYDFGSGFTNHMNRHQPEPPRPRPPTNEIDAVATKIQQEAEYLAEHSQAARMVVDFCSEANRQIKVATGNMLDLKMLLAVAVVGVTIFEVGAASATPVWVTLALFGLNHFIEMQQEAAEEAAAAVPVRP